MIGGNVDNVRDVIPDNDDGDNRGGGVKKFEAEELEEYTAELLQRLKKNKDSLDKEEIVPQSEVFQSCDTKESTMILCTLIIIIVL